MTDTVNASDDDLSVSKLSLNSAGSQSEDWDRSIDLSDNPPLEPGASGGEGSGRTVTTPRNSVAFPVDLEATPGKSSVPKKDSGSIRGKPKRSLTQMLKEQHGGAKELTMEEASEVANVLGQWINAGSSPYEGEDDFFTRPRAYDDLVVPSPRLTPKDPRARTVSATSTSSRSSVKGDAKGH